MNIMNELTLIAIVLIFGYFNLDLAPFVIGWAIGGIIVKVFLESRYA